MKTKISHSTVVAPLIVIALAVVLLFMGSDAEVSDVAENTSDAVIQNETLSDIPIDGPLADSYSTEGSNSLISVVAYHSPSSLADIARIYTNYLEEREYTILESSHEDDLLTLLGVANGTKMSVVSYENGSRILVEVALTRPKN